MQISSFVSRQRSSHSYSKADYSHSNCERSRRPNCRYHATRKTLEIGRTSLPRMFVSLTHGCAFATSVLRRCT
nr:MAG TPA: hypothetical protein [Caudoviricetes sp.]